MREAFLYVCGPSPRREPLSRMEVVVQLFFYVRRFAVAHSKTDENFSPSAGNSRGGELSIFSFLRGVSCTQPQKYFSSPLPQAGLQDFCGFALFCLGPVLRLAFGLSNFLLPSTAPFAAGTTLRVASAYSTSSFCPKHHWSYSK